MDKRKKVVLILSLVFSILIVSFVFAIQVNAQTNCQVIWQNTYDMPLTVNSQLDVSFITQGCTSEANLRMTLNGQVVAGPVNGRVEYHWQGSSSNGEFQFCPELLLAGEWDAQENKCFTLHVHGATSSVQATAVPQQGQVVIVTATLSSPNIVVVPNGQGGGEVPGPNQILVVNNNLNLREGPGVDRKVITIVAVGTVLDYKGENPGDDSTRWFYAKFGDKLGWVKANRTKLGEGTTIIKIDVANPPTVVTVIPTATPAATQATATAGTCGTAPAPRLVVGQMGRSTNEGKPLNFRKAAGTDAEKNDPIPNGGEFLVSTGPDCVGGLNWYGVYYGSVFGYIAEGSKDGYFVEPVAGPTPTPEMGLTATPAPTMDTVVLNKDDVKVYEKPDTTSKVLFVAPKGTVAPFKLKFITMSKQVWYEIYTGNGTGWIRAEDAIWNGDDPTATPHAA